MPLLYVTHYHFSLWLRADSYGNGTEWSPIRPVIIRRVINKIGQFINHKCDDRQNWTTRSPVTNIIKTIANCEKKPEPSSLNVPFVFDRSRCMEKGTYIQVQLSYYSNLVPRVSPLPAPWNQGAGRGETLGTRLLLQHA